MKTYELADLLAVIDTDVQGNIRAIPFSYGAFLLHHGGIWLWLDETKRLTNDEKKEVFTALGLSDVTTATTSIDEKTVWSIGHNKPLMPMPFTLPQLDEFDKVSRGTITESIKPVDDEDFSAALIGVNANEIARFLLFREVPADKAVPIQTAAPMPMEAVGASGGTGTTWTVERKEAARAMMNELRGKGIKAFAANTATAFGVSATRLREVLNDKPKKAPAKKAKGIWGV